MTESKKIFCESVARLCNMAGCPELYAPIVKIASLCEADGQQPVQSNTGTDNTTMANIDLNKLPQEELDSLQAEFAKSAEAKKEVDAAKTEKETADQELETAQQTQSEINANIANKANATAAEAEKDASEEVNSEENA